MVDKFVRGKDSAPQPVINPLTPAEQQKQVLHVVRSFKDHYLAEIFFHPDQNATVAVIKPKPVHDESLDDTYTIRIDDRGNTHILRTGDALPLTGHLLIRRMFMLLCGLAIVAAVLVLII